MLDPAVKVIILSFSEYSKTLEHKKLKARLFWECIAHQKLLVTQN